MPEICPKEYLASLSLDGVYFVNLHPITIAFSEMYIEKPVDILIPFDLERIDIRYRNPVRAFFIIIFVVALIGFCLYSFSDKMIASGSVEAAALNLIKNVVIFIFVWIGCSISFKVLLYSINPKRVNGDNGVAPITKDVKTPFTRESPESVEEFIVTYLRSHRERWQIGCLYLALLNSYQIKDNINLFYDYLTSRYPDLRTTAVRNWQTAIKQVNERIRSNDDECQDEIEEISKKLKEFA